MIRELLSLGLTVADLRECRDRLDLLDEGVLPTYGGPGACARPSGVAERRLAVLDDEIARLTRLRARLAARLDTPGSPDPDLTREEPAPVTTPTGPAPS